MEVCFLKNPDMYGCMDRSDDWYTAIAQLLVITLIPVTDWSRLELEKRIYLFDNEWL